MKLTNELEAKVAEITHLRAELDRVKEELTATNEIHTTQKPSVSI